MDRLFDDVFQSFTGTGMYPLMDERLGRPKIEFSDTDNALTVLAELPGMSEKDVQVEIANGILTIRGEKSERKEAVSASGPTAPSSGGSN